MKSWLSISILFVIISILPLQLNAQNTSPAVFTIKSNFTNNLSSNLSDTSGKTGSKAFEIGFEIPLYKNFFSNTSGKKAYWDLSLQSNNTITRLNIDFLPHSYNLLNLSYGLRGMYFTGNKNIWLTRLSINLLEDEYSIANATTRFSGSFVFNRLHNKNFSYHLGLTYRYSFGIASILPVGGFKYSFSDKWKIYLSIPFLARAQYKINKNLLLSAMLHPSGSLNYFTNNDNLFGQTKDYFLFRKRASTFAFNAMYRLNSDITLRGDIGWESMRKIYFSDIKTDINKEPANYFTSSIQSGGFINIGLILKFNKKRNPSSDNQEIFDYLTDDGFEL